jgi:hypothetical protein
MRPRHAAALALVGWYLMVPPLVRKQNTLQEDTSQPLSKWTQFRAFDSAQDCERDRDSILKARETVNYADALQDRCVESDDPRLK